MDDDKTATASMQGGSDERWIDRRVFDRVGEADSRRDGRL